MQALYEGEKRTIEVQVIRRRGSGTFSVTAPERRILDEARNVVTDFDWSGANWNADESIVSALFDSTQAGLSAPGLYYMQFRFVIGTDRIEHEVAVQVREWGP